jgi:hypothetical protein
MTKTGFTRNPKKVRIQGADFKMQKNVAMAMSSVGVHNFSCVLSSTRCTTKVVNSNLRNQINRGNFEIASQEPEFFKVASSLRHPWRKMRIRFLRSEIANYLKLRPLAA